MQMEKGTKMTEYIDKAKLLEELREKQLVLEQNGYYNEANSFLAMREVYIKELPTIDIVTCKDCKYSNVDKMGWYCNKHYHRYADENTHFCSDGEVEY